MLHAGGHGGSPGRRQATGEAADIVGGEAQKRLDGGVRRRLGLQAAHGRGREEAGGG